jgi:site-specific recombinase XerD
MFTLRSFFNWCAEQNLCRRNPALDIQLDRIDHKGRTRFADLELAQRLIQNAPTDDLRFVLFGGFHTGMRKLEIVEAVPEWFNLSTRTVEIRAPSTFRPKDRDARTVPLTDQFADFLKAMACDRLTCCSQTSRTESTATASISAAAFQIT